MASEIDRLNEILELEGQIPQEQFIQLLQNFKKGLEDEIIHKLEEDNTEKKIVKALGPIINPDRSEGESEFCLE